MTLILKAGSPPFYTNLMDTVNRGHPYFFFDAGNADALSQARGFLLVTERLPRSCGASQDGVPRN